MSSPIVRKSIPCRVIANFWMRFQPIRKSGGVESAEPGSVITNNSVVLVNVLSRSNMLIETVAWRVLLFVEVSLCSQNTRLLVDFLWPNPRWLGKPQDPRRLIREFIRLADASASSGARSTSRRIVSYRIHLSSLVFERQYFCHSANES